MRPAVRIVLWTAGSLAAAALACVLLIAGLAGSETASRRLLGYLSDYAGIEIGSMSGALATGMQLETLRYSGGGADVRIGELGFDWQPWALLHGTVGFLSLRLDGVRIEYAPAEPAPASPGKKELPDFSLPLRISLAAAEIHDLRVNYAGREYKLDYIRLDGAFGSTLDLDQLTLRAPPYELSAQGSLDAGFPYQGELSVKWRYESGTAEFAGAAAIEGDLNGLEVEHRLALPVELLTAGRVVTGLGDAPPRAELRNHWSRARLQPPLVPFAMDTTGELRITGWVDDYRLQGQGNVAVESQQVPSFRFALDAGGDLGGLDAADLELEALEGTIAARGAVQWRPRFEWNAGITAQRLDLSRYHPRAPSELRLSLHAGGERTEDGQWRAQFEGIEGSGRAGGYPLRLEGALEFDGAAFNSPSLKLRVAENALTLSGRAGRRLDVQWKLAAPGLAALWPGLEGSLSGGGRITGSRDSPRFQADLAGRNLAYGDYRIEGLSAALQTAKPGRHALTLDAAQVGQRGRTLSALRVNARGDAAAHAVEVRIEDDYLAASSYIEGGYRDSRWQGTLRSARGRAGDLPEWSLRQPVGIDAGPGGVRIEQACWSAAQARLCARLDARGNEIRGEASLASVPAGLLDPWLPPAVGIEGEIGGGLTVSGPNWRDLSGALELEAPAGRLGVRREGMPTEYYRWENARLQANLRDRRLHTAANLAFPGYGAAESAVSLDLRDRSLDGAVSARFDNLAPLQTVVTDLDGLQGSLRAAVNLAGTLGHPRFTGSLLLQDASARVPRLGIQIHGVQFSARSDHGNDVVFTGRAGSGGGGLEVSGKLVLGETPLLEASIEGEAFQILRQPQVQASISPQLNIQARPGEVSIGGSVRIPSARIEILEPPESTVAVSDDVIIVDPAGRPPQPENGVRLTARVRLILGDDVQFQGFGFNAGLDGELALNKTPGRPVATTGELRVRQGQYKAFGQKLEIDRGRLLFQGPYDNPGLDILAVRKTPDVTVSLEIGGTLENPRSRVFSEPPLPDSEAMAILLTGKPLGSASETEANALVNAVAGLGLRKGQFIADEIARAFNLDEFRIRTESDVTESSLLIGKQISPRLFIRYIVGLFDQTSRIGLSYRLSRHLRLEAESGWNQSMDLIYEIER